MGGGGLYCYLLLLQALANAASGHGPANPCMDAQDRAQAEQAAFEVRHAHDDEWMAREVGNVPMRWVHGYQTMDDFCIPWQSDLDASVIGDTCSGDYESVPPALRPKPVRHIFTESLGRDA